MKLYSVNGTHTATIPCSPALNEDYLPVDVEGIVNCGYQATGASTRAQIATADPNIAIEVISAAVSMMMRSMLDLRVLYVFIYVHSLFSVKRLWIGRFGWSQQSLKELQNAKFSSVMAALVTAIHVF